MRRAFVVIPLVVLALAGCSGGDSTDGGSPLDAGPSDAGVSNTCAPPTVDGGTTHTSYDGINTDEVWTAAGSPHHVTGDYIVRGRTLTIEPCATVLLDAKVSLRLDGAGKLVARGMASQPITFDSSSAGVYGGGLEVGATEFADLAYVNISHWGDDSQNTPAPIQISGDDNAAGALALVRAEQVTISSSGGAAVSMSQSGGFTADSHDLVITGSGQQVAADGYPVRSEALCLNTLPSGRYTGNARDAIQVHMRQPVSSDLHLRDPGVPYTLDGTLGLLSPASSVITFTLDPGVVLELAPGSSLSLHNSDGQGGVRWVAQGTAAKPIRITSAAAQPAPGDWTIVDWSLAPPDGNVLDHVTLEYGGAANGFRGFGCGPDGDNSGIPNSDGLLFVGWDPGSSFITGSTFQHSASAGIISGWSNGSSTNLAAGNTFVDIANQCNAAQPAPCGGAVGLCF